MVVTTTAAAAAAAAAVVAALVGTSSLFVTAFSYSPFASKPPPPRTVSSAGPTWTSLTVSFHNAEDENHQRLNDDDDDVTSSLSSSWMDRKTSSGRRRQQDSSIRTTRVRPSLRSAAKDYYYEKSSIRVAMAILTALVGTGDCFGSTSALAVDADAVPSNAGIFPSAAEAAAVLSSESSPFYSSAVIESMPPSAIGGKALVLPDGATSDDSSSPDDGDTTAAGMNGIEISDEIAQSADAAPATSDTSPILSSTETAAVSANSDTEDKSEMTRSIQLQEEEVPAVVSAGQQSSVATFIEKDNDKNYDYDDISLSVLSQLGNTKNTAAVSEVLENISLLVAPAAIVAVLALLTSPLTVQEDARNSEDTVDITSSAISGGEIDNNNNSNSMSNTLKETKNAIVDGKKLDAGSRKEWTLNAPIPYGLQEGTPKWSSLPPPPPKKKQQSKSVAPLFAASPSSPPPTLALKQPEKTIDRGPFRSTTTTSFGKSTIVNDLSSPSSQAIKLPQKGAISTSGSSMPSSSTLFTKQQQPQKGLFVAPATTSATDVSVAKPKSFAKSTYKKSSLDKTGQQQPLPYATPSIAVASSGVGNIKAAPVSSSDESGSDMKGAGMTKKQVTIGTSTTRPATAPQPPMKTRDSKSLKGAMSAPAGSSNIQKTVSSSLSSDRAGIVTPAVSAKTAPKSYAKSSYKKSYTNRNTEQSTPINNLPAPVTTFATEPTSGGLIRDEGMVGNEIIAGGMLKGQSNVGGSSLKSYSKSSFKSNNIGAAAPSGIPGGGYLTDLINIPLSPTGSISSITEAARAKGDIVPRAVYLDTKDKSNGGAGGRSVGGSGGDGVLKGTTGDTSPGTSTRFGGGVTSFKKGNGSVFGGPTSRTDSPKRETEFLSDFAQAKVPSNVGPSSSSPTSSDQPTDISPSQLASTIPRTSSTPTSPAGIQSAKSRLQDGAMTTVRIGSATRMGSPAASQGNTNQRGWNPVLNNDRSAGSKPLAGSRSIGQQRPQSVTITDPRTGKQRTISVSDASVPANEQTE